MVLTVDNLTAFVLLSLFFCVLVTCRGSKEVRKYVISGVVNNLVTQ